MNIAARLRALEDAAGEPAATADRDLVGNIMSDPGAFEIGAALADRVEEVQQAGNDPDDDAIVRDLAGQLDRRFAAAKEGT